VIVGEVVGQIGALDGAGEGVGGETGDVGVVGLVVAVGEEVERGDNGGRVAAVAQIGEGKGRASMRSCKTATMRSMGVSTPSMTRRGWRMKGSSPGAG